MMRKKEYNSFKLKKKGKSTKLKLFPHKISLPLTPLG